MLVRRAEIWQRHLAECADSGPGVLLLLDGDDEVVGFSALGASRDPDAGPTVGEVGAIYLRAAAWGRSWGRALMDASFVALARAGFTSATLWVLDSNGRARRFYEAAGWRLDGSTKVDVVGGQARTELRYHRSLVPSE